MNEANGCLLPLNMYELEVMADGPTLFQFQQPYYPWMKWASDSHGYMYSNLIFTAKRDHWSSWSLNRSRSRFHMNSLLSWQELGKRKGHLSKSLPWSSSQWNFQSMCTVHCVTIGDSSFLSTTFQQYIQVRGLAPSQ